MKAVALVAALFAAPQVFASELGCTTSVQIAVASKLLEANRANEKVGTPELVTTANEFDTYAVFKVRADSTGGIPSHSIWLVVAEKGPMATCTVKGLYLDYDIQ